GGDAPARRARRSRRDARHDPAGARRGAGWAPRRRVLPGRAPRLPRLQLPDRVPGSASRGGRGAVSRRVSARQLPLFAFEAPPRRLELVPDLPVDEGERRAARLLETDLVLRAGAGPAQTHTLA